MVLTEHKKFYNEIFKIKGFLESPFLMFGFQELSPGFSTRLKDAKSFKGLLHLMGVKEVTVLDYEDKRADVHFDMNYPFDQNTNKLIGACNVVADVGCLEHVFNSAQAMKNCMDAVKVGGLYFLHTPVAGYCKHGLHTFNHDMLKWVLRNNGFEIEYCHYSDKEGNEIPEPRFNYQGNVIIWLVARRIRVKDKFHIPIQDRQKIHESYKTVMYPWKDEGKRDGIGPRPSDDTKERHPNNWDDHNSKLNIVGIGVSKDDQIGTAGKEGLKAGKKLRGVHGVMMNSDKPTSKLSKSSVKAPPSPKPEKRALFSLEDIDQMAEWMKGGLKADVKLREDMQEDFPWENTKASGGYVGEGHDPVDLINQNLNM